MWGTTTRSAPPTWNSPRFRIGSSPGRNSSRPTHCEYSRHRDRRSRYPARLIGLISVANGIVQCGERFELVSVARNQLALGMLYSNQRPEASPLISKNQSGRLNGRGLRPSGIVWKCRRGTEISIANPVLAAPSSCGCSARFNELDCEFNMYFE